MSEETIALQELRARGVTDAERLLHCAAPQSIIATCRWWDGLSGVNKGLLVRRIQEGGVAEEEAQAQPSVAELRRREQLARFNRAVERLPEGAVVEPHSRLQQRRYPEDEPCPGALRALESIFPNLQAECELCGFLVAYPVAALSVLNGRRVQ